MSFECILGSFFIVFIIIGFAFPINIAKNVANELIIDGQVTRPWSWIPGRI